MKRRDFLKILGACVIAPGVTVAAVKAKLKPKRYSICGDRYYAWKHYYTTYHYKNDKESKEMLEKFHKTFKKHKFQKPIPYGIPYWVTLRTRNYNRT